MWLLSWGRPRPFICSLIIITTFRISSNTKNKILNEVLGLKRLKNFTWTNVLFNVLCWPKSHNNHTHYQTILMTFNNEIPSFYNKANPMSINGESQCFNVSVETKVPPGVQWFTKCQSVTWGWPVIRWWGRGHEKKDGHRQWLQSKVTYCSVLYFFSIL